MHYYLAIDQYRITNNQFTKSGSQTFNPLNGRSIHYLARKVLVTPNTIFFGSPDGKNSPDGTEVIEPAYLYQFKFISSLD